MLNYFNYKKFKEKYLITNDAGYFAFLTESEFQNLLQNKIELKSELGKQLIDKCFVYKGDRENLLSRFTVPLRTENDYLFESTPLNIFVVTTACNLQCIYCQARSGDEKSYGFMDEETAERAVDFALQSPNRELTFEFQGGETLANFKTIRHIVEYTEEHKKEKKINFSIVTNLLLLTDEIIDFVKEHNIGLSTSLDGCEIVHNHNRPFVNGDPSWRKVVEKIHIVQGRGIPLGAIETTTRFGLNYPHELIDTYRQLGFKRIFIRPLTPLGYATKNWQKIGYSPEKFLKFYRECLQYILELDRYGECMAESHAMLFLRKILCSDAGNYMELRSPCGGVVGQMAYFYNGDIYTCDEGRMLGEMGDPIFRLGNVKKDTYDNVVNSNSCKALMSSSFLQSIPECCDCVYQPYCGTCPVVNYKLYHDIYPNRPDEFRCKIYQGMLDIIFDYLYEDNPETVNILNSWI